MGWLTFIWFSIIIITAYAYCRRVIGFRFFRTNLKLIMDKLGINRINFKIKSDLNKLEILFDRTNLIRIINNLVKNSIQATSEINYPEIIVRVKKNIRYAIIEIKDNGTGIPNSLKEKIFEPSFTTKTKGMGLGLSIIKNLIVNYQGNISFQSKKGETIFKIKIPLA